MSSHNQSSTGEPITRDDIEARFRKVKEQVDERAEKGKRAAIPAGIGVAILILFLSYLIGKRVGKKRSSIVEIRRI